MQWEFFRGLLSAGVFFALGQQVSVSSFFVNLFGLQGAYGDVFCFNGPLWSLAYEIWFYILIGSLGVVFNRKTSTVPLLIALAFLVFSAMIFTKLLAVYLMCWCFGGLAYCFLERKVHWSVIIASVFLAILGCFFSQIGSASKSISLTTFSKLIPSKESADLILAVGISGFLPTLAKVNLTSRIACFVDQIMKYGANLSYTLYLIHYPLIAIMFDKYLTKTDSINSTSIKNIFLVTALVAVSTLVMYFLFERNTSTVRKWIRNLLTSQSSESHEISKPT